MLKLGVIERVDEHMPWISPMVVIKKPNGKIRICIDYTKLNRVVKCEVYPMATVEGSLARLSRGNIFSKLDCNSGFWQIRIHGESRNLTTFLSPQGRFRFCRLPFELTSAPEIFQREISRILVGLDQVTVHMDGILIATETLAEHNKVLNEVMSKVKSAGLTLNLEKCSVKKRIHLSLPAITHLTTSLPLL